eukprot:4494579-Pleurochrysis_carterae.AAC.3
MKNYLKRITKDWLQLALGRLPDIFINYTDRLARAPCCQGKKVSMRIYLLEPFNIGGSDSASGRRMLCQRLPSI